MVIEVVSLIKAKEEHADILFYWINDPDVRRQSFSFAIISYEDHIQWFKKKIANPDCYLYIAYLKDQPVGMIRFDVKNTNVTISYLIDKIHRGKGIGTEIIRRGIEKFLQQSSFRGVIIADVKISNHASIKIFERSDFEKEKLDENTLRFKRNIA